MTAAALLDRLDKVRRTGPATWIACCPAHDDRGPSLSVRELDDGRVLLHDFAGCSTEEVLAALGLTFDDLYPERTDGAIDHRRRGERRPFPATDCLRVISREALHVALVASRLGAGRPLTDEGRERLLLSAQRIDGALAAAGVTP